MSALLEGNNASQQSHHESVQPNAASESHVTDMMLPQKEPPKTPFGSHGNAPIKNLQIKGRPGSLELVIDPDAPLIHILEELRQLLLANSALLKHASSLTLNFNSREIDRLQYSEIQRLVESHGLSVTGISLQPDALLSFLEGEFGVPVQIQTASPKTAPLPESPPEQSIATPMSNTGNHPSPLDVLRSEAPTPHQTPVRTATPTTIPVTRRLNATPAGSTAQTHRPTPAMPPMPALNPVTPRTHAHQTYQAEAQAPVARPVSAPPQPASAPPPSVSPSESSQRRQLHKVMRTLRAGSALHFDGDVVVFGDLNAGAEIKATGDIIVLGSLRGVAHAGYQGDTSARIFANDLSPTQLRLAHQIAIAPPHDVSRQRTRMSLEMAFLNDSKQIEVKNVDAGRIPV